MASRSGYRTDWAPLVAACAQVDIVIADRWLPKGCTPRWLKADGKALSETGGLAIRLDPPKAEAVAASWRGTPWGSPPTIMPPKEAPSSANEPSVNDAAEPSAPTPRQ
jgi:competence protein ComEC